MIYLPSLKSCNFVETYPFTTSDGALKSDFPETFENEVARHLIPPEYRDNYDTKLVEFEYYWEICQKIPQNVTS